MNHIRIANGIIYDLESMEIDSYSILIFFYLYRYISHERVRQRARELDRADMARYPRYSLLQQNLPKIH
jgi:hypothetical protein